MPRPIRAHSGVFRQMQMLARLARLKNTHPKTYDRAMEELIGGRPRRTDEGRRKFLKTGAGVAAGTIGLEMLESIYKRARAAGPKTPLNVAIVGGGIAGLNCAWQLRKMAKAGQLDDFDLNVTIYEGRPNRTGGRMLTSRGDVARGMHCELGAEFVDSSNDDMFSLVQDPDLGDVCRRHFGHELAMLDCGQDHTNNQLIGQHLWVKGQHHTVEEAIAAMCPFAAKAVEEMSAITNECERIKLASRGNQSCGGTGSLGFNNFGIPSGAARNAQIARFDAMNVRQYFDQVLQIPRDHWLYAYFEAAYVTEYGIPLEDQSALSAVTLLGFQESADEAGRLVCKPDVQVDVFGPSDERFKVIGGNDKVVRCLTIALMEGAKADGRSESPIKLGHKLVKVERQDQRVERLRSTGGAPRRNTARDTKYLLKFENNATVSNVDLLVLACPFTMLSTKTVAEYTAAVSSGRFKTLDALRKEWPRFARMSRNEPDYQPTFTPPADLSALGIDQGSPDKARTVNKLGYGRNMKLMAGFDRPVWREQKPTATSSGRYGGYTFSDRPFQMGWDSGECQDLAQIPAARQRMKGLDAAGNPLLKKNGTIDVEVEIVKPVRNPSVAQGRQFSWFLGGGISAEDLAKGKPQNFGERILFDQRLKGFVTHTLDNRPTPDGDIIARAKGFVGEGITDPKYRTPGLWDQHSRAIGEIMNQIVADTATAYDGFSESFLRQSQVMGRQASSSMIWTNDPFVKGSYTAYNVGQWTTMSGMEGAPLTFDGTIAPESQAGSWTLFFAGEHCSSEFLGFMNGGAQTGRLAAQRILMALVGAEAARRRMRTELAGLYLPSRRSLFVSGLDRVFG